MKTRKGELISMTALYGLPVIAAIGAMFHLPLVVEIMLFVADFIWLGVCIWFYQQPKKGPSLKEWMQLYKDASPEKREEMLKEARRKAREQ